MDPAEFCQKVDLVPLRTVLVLPDVDDDDDDGGDDDDDDDNDDDDTNVLQPVHSKLTHGLLFV